MSRHLRVLLKAGIVAVQAWLDQLQAHGDEQLASFKRHVERRGGR